MNLSFEQNEFDALGEANYVMSRVTSRPAYPEFSGRLAHSATTTILEQHLHQVYTRLFVTKDIHGEYTRYSTVAHGKLLS